MTTSLKKAPEVTLWGFRFVYHLDTISFFATSSVSQIPRNVKDGWICPLSGLTKTAYFHIITMCGISFRQVKEDKEWIFS